MKKITDYDFCLPVIKYLLSSNNDTIQPPYPQLPQNHLSLKVDKIRIGILVFVKVLTLCQKSGKCVSQLGLCLVLCFEEFHNQK